MFDVNKRINMKQKHGRFVLNVLNCIECIDYDSNI